MSFLALLIAVLIWNFSTVSPRMQQDAWLLQWYKKLDYFLPSPLSIVFAIALPGIGLAIVIEALEHIVFGLFALIATVVVIIYGFGRGDLRTAWNLYGDEWQRGDYEAAYQQSLQMGVISAEDPVETPFALHQHIRAAFCYHALERWFAPVFWFMALGPAAIIAYRLLIIASRWQGDEYQSLRQWVVRALLWFEWLPARLLAFTFALAANFSTGFQRFQEMVFAEKPVQNIVGDCAIAALELPLAAEQYESSEKFVAATAREMIALKSLVKRSHVLWLVVSGFLMLL